MTGLGPKIRAQDLKLVIFSPPARVVNVPGAGAMVVDAKGMNCVRHRGDRFPLVMERYVADAVMADAIRDGKAAQ